MGNRLTKKVTVGGTPTTTTYTYNDANELASVGSTTYTHDPNGNLTADGKYTYEYDAEDRLTAVKENGSTVASFTYRSDGMRKTMTTSSGTITFHYDENKNVTYETNTSNTIVASYTYNNGNQPVSMTRGSTTYYYQLNGHGDVVSLTTGNGTVVATYTYDAFGNVINETGTVENPYRYAGYRYDKVTSLYYLQARYYQPNTGRFLTQDVFSGFDASPLSQNQYIYVQNDPVNNVDPDGRLTKRIYLSKSRLNSTINAAKIILSILGFKYYGVVGFSIVTILGFILDEFKDRGIGNRGIRVTIRYHYRYYYGSARYLNYGRKRGRILRIDSIRAVRWG